jgi:cytosine/uracil/thiamine/allantoin permease
LAKVEVAEVGAFWVELYHYAWFISFGIAFVVHMALAAVTRGPRAG